MINAHIRPATADDLEPMLAILPRLAEFSVPAKRNPKHLWEGDAEALKRWAATGDEQCIVLVADAAGIGVVGVAFVRLRPELLSRAPSAHLDALAVAPVADGHGLGRRLLAEAEAAARARGAQSLTLHVFANNHRARSVYQRQGYDSELIRCIKWLGDN